MNRRWDFSRLKFPLPPPPPSGPTVGPAMHIYTCMYVDSVVVYGIFYLAGAASRVLSIRRISTITEDQWYD